MGIVVAHAEKVKIDKTTRGLGCKSEQGVPNMTRTRQTNRRDFLRSGAALAASAATGTLEIAIHAQGAGLAPPRTSIGIQVGSASFVDEGTDKVLDIFQDRGAIDTIYLTTFTFGRGLAGRQIPGQLFPDHGVRASDERTFRGGNYATPHAEFYRKTELRPGHAPDHGDLDVVATVAPAAKKRGMRVFCSIEDVSFADVPGVKETAEIDVAGNRPGTLCLCHPDVRAFWTALATDLAKSYEIDGILFFNERNGPLLNALGASHAQNIASSRVTCFCEHHRRAAKALGIDFQRAREGYQKLDEFVRAALRGERPDDGYFVEFWRLLGEWPEILAWNRLFDEAKHQVVADVTAAVKAVRAGLQVGFHIEHVNSFNPIFRAAQATPI